MKKVFLLLAATATIITACETNANKSGGTGTDSKMTDTTATMAESKTERNKKIIMASMDAMQSKNVDEMLKDCSSDCVDYGDGSMKPVKGKDSIAAMIKQWLNAFPDNKG